MPNTEESFKRVEVLWDYDWILYHQYEDWRCVNIHNGNTFYTYKTKEQYWLTYQFNKDWELNWYSTFKASGLNLEDDLNAIENQLWGQRWLRWDKELEFRPIKEMSYLHIKNILRDYETGYLKIEPRMLAYFKSIIEIDYATIQKG